MMGSKGNIDGAVQKILRVEQREKIMVVKINIVGEQRKYYFLFQ